jgi:acetaldehyde dehydrogenase/alcohol dehydrogenase
LILAEVQPYDFDSVLLREKLAPILSFIRNADDKMALDHAYEILELEGKGHTAIIHTNDKDRVRAFSVVVQVSRVLVSTAGTQGCIGADNGLNLSWTLGCGTMGGGSVSDNVSYTHLQNNKRIAY